MTQQAAQRELSEQRSTEKDAHSTTQKIENEENKPTRKIVTTNITARGSSSSGAHGREKEKGRAEWLRMNGTNPHTRIE